MRDDEKFTEDEINLLSNCLLQSISNNHRYAQESLQNKIEDISSLSYSSSDERIEKLKKIIESITFSIEHINRINEFLNKIRK